MHKTLYNISLPIPAGAHGVDRLAIPRREQGYLATKIVIGHNAY